MKHFDSTPECILQFSTDFKSRKKDYFQEFSGYYDHHFD